MKGLSVFDGYRVGSNCQCLNVMSNMNIFQKEWGGVLVEHTETTLYIKSNVIHSMQI